MRQSVVIPLLMLLGIVTVAQAEPESKPSSDPADSPKAALKAQDAAARAGRADEDMSFYQAESEQQKKLAHAAGELDVAVAQLEKSVERKFGKELASSVAHAAGNVNLSDIESATEKIDGEKATLQWNDRQLPALQMVKADGKWKISLTDMLKEADPAEVDRLTRNIQQFAGELNKIEKLVEEDKFRSGEGVRDRVQELHSQVFADQQ